jgi:SPP1 family phage portal protein
MDSKKLEKLYNDLSGKKLRIKRNEAYVLGKNPPIINKEQEKKPDNRIPITLAKMTVDDMAGYAGKQGSIDVAYDLISTDTPDDNDPFIRYMREMDSFNEADIENSELYYEVLEQGEAYEIFWTSDAMGLPGGLLTTEYKIVPAEEISLVYNNDLKKKLIYAVHYIDDDDIKTANVYYPLYMEVWVKRKDSDEWVLMDEWQYPFTEVPVNKFKGNRRGLPIFEAEKHLIDTIDEIVSKSLNEIDRFSSAILLMGSEVSEDIAKGLRENKVTILDNLASDMDTGNFEPKFLEKSLSGVKDFYNEMIDKVEQWYRDSTKTVDMSDEKFGGDTTGIALKLKLIPMEFRAAQIETYFNMGLKKRLKFYGDVYNASVNSVNLGDYETKITSHRNIPIDEAAIVEMLQKLIGTISKEALLTALPQSIIPDVGKELARQEEEMSSNMISFDDVDGIAEGQDLDNIQDSGVEAIVLNGAQVTAAKGIASDVAAGLLTRESGIQLIMSLGIPREQAELMVPAQGVRSV